MYYVQKEWNFNMCPFVGADGNKNNSNLNTAIKAHPLMLKHIW